MDGAERPLRRMIGFLALSCVALFSLLSGCSYIETGKDGDSQGIVTITITTIGSNDSEDFSFETPTFLSDSLVVSHDVEFSSFRNYIKCVDAVCARGGYYWAIEVNGASLTSSATSYELSDGDHIHLIYRD
ncbi:MAG: DUF4430 domain-containing protein [archaeon]